MECYQVNGKWVVEVFGGNNNNNDIQGEKRTYDTMPEPVKQWKDTEEGNCGVGRSKFTQFKAEKDGTEVFFTIEKFAWIPSFGYSWDESWEAFNNYIQPPALGDAFRWTGERWEGAKHPMEGEKQHG